MKTLLLILAYVIAILGVLSLTTPVAAVSGYLTQGEKEQNVSLLLFVLPLVFFSMAALIISIIYIIKRNPESAKALAGITGFATWLILNTKATIYYKADHILVGLIALIIPIVSGIVVYKLLIRGIRQNIGNEKSA